MMLRPNLPAKAIILLLWLGAAGNGIAQPASSQAALFVVSEPPGAFVELAGELTYAGRTPFLIPYRLSGTYKLTARHQGFETLRSEFIIEHRSLERLRLKLRPRTPAKAVARSLLLPGWGQFYGQSRAKGALVSLTQAALGFAAWLAPRIEGLERTPILLLTSGFWAYNVLDAAIFFGRRPRILKSQARGGPGLVPRALRHRTPSR